MERLREQGFTSDAIYDEGQHEDLKKLLLNIGGGACVVPRVEPDKEKIMTRGELRMGGAADLREGLHNQCHQNAAYNYQQDGHPIVTGYALSDDGAWRQHTWNIDKSTGKVIETTEERTAYFGFVLEKDEASQFVDENPLRETVLTCNDADCRDYVFLRRDDGTSLLNVEDDRLELLFAGPPTGELAGSTIWVLTESESGLFLTASLFVEYYEHDVNARFSTHLISDEFVFLDDPVAITDGNALDDLSRVDKALPFSEIDDDGAVLKHLRSLMALHSD
jgi:hypothetical protein